MENKKRSLFLILFLCTTLLCVCTFLFFVNIEIQLPFFQIVFSNSIEIKKFSILNGLQDLLSPKQEIFKSLKIKFLSSPIHFSNNEFLLIGNSLDSSEKLLKYDSQSKKLIEYPLSKNQNSFICCLSLSPDKKRIAFYRHEKQLVLFSFSEKNEKIISKKALRGSSILWLDNNHLLFSTNDGITQIDISTMTGKFLSKDSFYLCDLRNSKEILCQELENKESLFLWNFEENEKEFLKLASLKNLGEGFLFSPDGEYLIYSKGWIEDKSVYIYSFKKRKSKFLFKGHFEDGFFLDYNKRV